MKNKQNKQNKIVMAFALASCIFPAIAQNTKPIAKPDTKLDSPPRFQITNSTITPAAPFSSNPRHDRVTFAGQPTKAQIIAFAQSGGKLLVNTRTKQEMDALDFNQAQLAKDLGLTYLHIPMSGHQINPADPFTLGQALAFNDGPVLMHCRSGSRAAMLYALHLVNTSQLTKDQALQKAIALGMRPAASPNFENAIMITPQSIFNAVDTARLIDHVNILAAFETRHTLSDTTSDTTGIGAARRWVFKAFQESIANHNRPESTAPFVTFDSHTVEPDGRRINRQVEIINVVCTIPGSNPESTNRLYYVLAHLDSRATDIMDSTSNAPGANDDASGVAALIELARVLSTANLDSTIVLMATSGEEQGLYGAKLHAADLVAAGADVRAVLNNDTIGDPTGPDGQDGSTEVRIFSEGLALNLVNLDEPAQLKSALSKLRSTGSESDSPSRQLARYINFVGKLHSELPVKPKLIFRPDRFLRGGDHTPFNQLGMAAVRFCEVYENYDHQHQDIRIEDGLQYGDLPTFVDALYLTGVTKLNAAVLTHIANAPSSPANARIITADLTNDTTLRWTPSPESNTAGYEILWRATTGHDWTHFKDVGNTTEATINLSKDNWLFAIRAYDQEGYRSPATYPTPAHD